MKLAYIFGPYTADTKEAVKRNIHEAELVGQQVLAKGYIPIIPHKITSFWDEWGHLKHWGWNDWMERFCLPLLERCDIAVPTPGWEFSPGGNTEYDWCVKHGKPVFSVEEL